MLSLSWINKILSASEPKRLCGLQVEAPNVNIAKLYPNRGFLVTGYENIGVNQNQTFGTTLPKLEYLKKPLNNVEHD